MSPAVEVTRGGMRSFPRAAAYPADSARAIDIAPAAVDGYFSKGLDTNALPLLRTTVGGVAALPGARIAGRTTRQTYFTQSYRDSFTCS
jgi:hypothetical protein